jgi:hypothetical protein
MSNHKSGKPTAAIRRNSRPFSLVSIAALRTGFVQAQTPDTLTSATAALMNRLAGANRQAFYMHRNAAAGDTNGWGATVASPVVVATRSSWRAWLGSVLQPQWLRGAAVDPARGVRAFPARRRGGEHG